MNFLQLHHRANAWIARALLSASLFSLFPFQQVAACGMEHGDFLSYNDLPMSMAVPSDWPSWIDPPTWIALEYDMDALAELPPSFVATGSPSVPELRERWLMRTRRSYVPVMDYHYEYDAQPTFGTSPTWEEPTSVDFSASPPAASAMLADEWPSWIGTPLWLTP